MGRITEEKGYEIGMKMNDYIRAKTAELYAKKWSDEEQKEWSALIGSLVNIKSLFDKNFAKLENEFYCEYKIHTITFTKEGGRI